MKHKKKQSKPRFQRSDIPYSDRLLIQRMNTLAEHRNDAAYTALKLGCVALNESEGLGLFRLTRFARTLRGLIDEYYSDTEVGEVHLNQRLSQMGFVVIDGHLFVMSEEGALIPDEFPEEGFEGCQGNSTEE